MRKVSRVLYRTVLAVVATTVGIHAAEPAAVAPSGVGPLVKAAMDAGADPCRDFYRYACGGWLDATELPADQSRWGRGFSEIAERNRVVLREILDNAAKAPEADRDRTKLGRFYASCMDEAAIEKAGVEPLRPMFASITGVKDPAALLSVVGAMHRQGATPLFGLGVVADFKNPDLNIAFMSQGGLGLPDRDYYLKDDDASKALKKAYEETVGRMLALAGEPEDTAAKSAAAIVAFENELAKLSRPRVEMRDPDKLYNKIDLDGLQKLTPALPWKKFLEAVGHPEVRQINVAVPEFYRGLDALVPSTDLDTLKVYLRWHWIRSTSDLLPKAFVDEAFAFYGKKLAGQKELQPRWKRCVQATDGALGELLGRDYVERQFAGDSKAIALDLIHRIEEAFAANLANLAWMDDVTRSRALTKKDTLTNKIGYPDRWRDYARLAIKKGDYFEAALAARRFEFDFEAAKIGKPVDKKEWGMTPPTVNAYYNPLVNEMVFPAGILQPPFFDRSFPMVMNFGGIGMVMGHELTHGFDDQGRKFDPTGKLREWWEPNVSAKFDERAACVDRLYSGYEVQPGLKLNGKLTLGENIADLGGIKQSFQAWQAYASEHPDAARPAVEGLSNDQLFFVAFAQTWCSLQTPEIERVLVNVDPHSHPRYRVFGPLAQLPAFAAAFQCAEGTPMNPTERCEVW